MSSDKRDKRKRRPEHKKRGKSRILRQVRAFALPATLILQLIDIIIRLWEIIK